MGHQKKYRPMTKRLVALTCCCFGIIIGVVLLLLLGGPWWVTFLTTSLTIITSIIAIYLGILQILANHTDFYPATKEMYTVLLGALLERGFRWVKTRIWPLLCVVLLVTLAITLVFLVNIPSFPWLASSSSQCTLPTHASASDHYIDVTKIDSGPSVGISEGKDIFDTTAADFNEKLHAADLYKHSSYNNSELINAWYDAHLKASNDAEALIYQEDLKVKNQRGQNYLDIVLGVNFEGDNLGGTRDILQGAYIAQTEFNRAHPGGLQIRLLIANSGSSETRHIGDVMCQVVDAAKPDQDKHHIVGMMGWFLSRDVLDSLPLINENHFLLVSATASSTDLSNNAYFLRINPSDLLQGQAAANYAQNKLHAHRIAVFVNGEDTYSRSLANSFCKQYSQTRSECGTQPGGTQPKGAIVALEQYTPQKSLQDLVRDALRKGADLLYFAGYARDAKPLFQELKPCKVSFPVDAPFDAHCPAVLGGDALSIYGDYSTSSSVGAGLPKGRVFYTAFAEHDEWSGEPPLHSPRFNRISPPLLPAARAVMGLIFREEMRCWRLMAFR